MDALKGFLNKEDLPESIKSVFNKYIDRKLVKTIFMPILHGKTQMSTADDIKTALKDFIPLSNKAFCWPLSASSSGENKEMDGLLNPDCRLVCFNL